MANFMSRLGRGVPRHLVPHYAGYVYEVVKLTFELVKQIAFPSVGGPHPTHGRLEQKG